MRPNPNAGTCLHSIPSSPGALFVSRSTAVWVGALALALALLGADSARRLGGVELATDTPMGARLEPEPDAASPSGYRWGQHRLLLTQTDGYQWLLQTEHASESGALRVRATDDDGAPVGREVHWAGFMRWWVQGVAGAYRLTHAEMTVPQSLERVAPWANAALLAVLLLLLTPLVAASLGAVPAGLLALGSVTVFPFYDFFGVGYLDHHGVAAMSCLASVLFLVAGGAGWVRGATEAEARAPAERAIGEALPEPRVARVWFVLSGLAGAVGLWVSAASIVPVLIGIGLGALASGVAARGAPARAAWLLDPRLFRLWGVTGAAGSFVLYLLEYFPGDMGMRLEVNHPLYALAFLGAGDLLARVIPVAAGRTTKVAEWARGQAGWLAADLALVLALPMVILVTGESTFRLTDPFLFILHDRYIVEFLDLRAWTLSRTPRSIAGELSLVPLVAMPVAALLWPSGLAARGRVAWRALLVLLVAASAAYAFVFVLGLTRGNVAVALLGAAAAVGVWFALPLSEGAPELAPPLRSALVLAATPALLLLLVGLAQMRWLGIAAALWLGALVATVAVLIRSRHPMIRTGAGRAAAGALAAAVLLVAPLFSMRGPFQPSRVDTVARDVSLWLRRRMGDERGVVLAAPGVTTQMIWFGGFRGIGTLYWENLDGLRASRAIYGATDPDSTRALLQRYGVTHVVFYGWDGGLEQLRLSATAAGLDPGDARGLLDVIEQGTRTNDFTALPPWLVPLPYMPPTVAGYAHPVVKVFEVADDGSPELALVRLARIYQLFGDQRMEPTLTRALELGPSVAGLAMMAQLQHVREERAAFAATIARLSVELERAQAVELGDRIEAAMAFGLAGDAAAVTREVELVLTQADEERLRRLSLDRLALLVDVSRRLGLDRTHAETLALAQRLLPPS
jgi:hypothetical protein